MISPKTLTDRALSLGLGTVRTAAGLGGRVVGEAADRARGLRHSRPAPKDLDDVTLARKVESVAFRGAGAARRDVKVSAVAGRVELRGTVRRKADIADLEARVRAVPEVADVDNRLTTAPAKRRAARTAPAAKKPPARAPRPRVRTDDQTSKVVADAERTPAELAEEGAGRQAAPLGASDPDAARTPGEKAEAALAKGAPAETGKG